jgi:hypothetical protein
MREMPILVPHTDYGDQECCGIIMPVESGDQADLVCNECGAVISSVEPTLLRMAMSGGLCSETCPHCGQLNTFPGFSSMEAYTCRHCDLGVIVRKPVQWRFRNWWRHGNRRGSGGGKSRRGGDEILALQAAMNGVQELAVMKQTRQKSADMLRRHVRDASLFRDNAGERIWL